MRSWYEESLSSRERKMRGHFSTPPQLIELILDACGYRPENDLASLRVLDPACGSGNFLIGAARRLLAAGKRVGLDSADIERVVQRNLWGFDPDPAACFLAEMQVREVLEREDAVLDGHAPSLHIHQADGLALAWDEGECVDLFLANPPYLAAKNSDLSGYRSTHRRGQADSYLLFLDLALRVVRPDGWAGLVLPDPVLARANAARERARLLRAMTIQHLWHLSGVFSAQVGAVVIIGRKQAPPRLHHIAWQRARWGQDADRQEHVISQEMLLKQPGAELRYLLSAVRNPLVERLHMHMSDEAQDGFAPLERFVIIRRGEELGKEAVLLQDLEDEQARYPVLRGGVDVRPYMAPRTRYWIERVSVVKPLERYLAPKLLVVKSTGLLQAALDLHGHIVLQTLYLLLPRRLSGAEEDLYFLLALLNSRLLQEYVYVLYTAYKWVQPQIEQSILARLPVPLHDAARKEQISQRARLLMLACSQEAPVVELSVIREMYEEQEDAINALYQAALQSVEQTEIQKSADKGVI